MSTERVIVQRDASEKLIPKITSLITGIRAGDPFNDSSVQLSALFNPGSAEGVIQMVKEAEEQGVDVIVGDKTRNGGVVQPHILLGVKPGMRAWERESFGPSELPSVAFEYFLTTPYLVVGITVVDTIDEAVELANSTDYSLVASVWTSDLSVGLQVGAKIRAGSYSYNFTSSFTFGDLYYFQTIQVARLSMDLPSSPNQHTDILVLGEWPTGNFGEEVAFIYSAHVVERRDTAGLISSTLLLNA